MTDVTNQVEESPAEQADETLSGILKAMEPAVAVMVRIVSEKLQGRVIVAGELAKEVLVAPVPVNGGKNIVVFTRDAVNVASCYKVVVRAFVPTTELNDDLPTPEPVPSFDFFMYEEVKANFSQSKQVHLYPVFVDEMRRQAPQLPLVDGAGFFYVTVLAHRGEHGGE